jgi:dCTP deaminase
MIISDETLRVRQEQDQIITPFVEDKITNIKVDNFHIDIPSYGTSHCGYDCRLASEFKIPNQEINSTLSITETDSEKWFTHLNNVDSYVIPPKGFVLSRTIEYFNIPKDIMGSFFCKSTLARVGLVLPPTVIEPGWCGHLVVEIFNASPFPIKIVSNVGIGQMVFFHLDQATSKPYEGKYHNQTGITCAKM